MMEVRTIESLTIDDIHDLFDSVIFLRGEEYYDEGCVSLIEPLDCQTIKGIVQGLGSTMFLSRLMLTGR